MPISAAEGRDAGTAATGMERPSSDQPGRVAAALRGWPVARDEIVACWERDDAGPPAAAIVIPCFDMAEWIGDAVASALAQTVPVEVVVRDDASSDGTPERALEAGKGAFARSLATRFVVLRGARNVGLGLNFSLALRETRSRWVFNFDADDLSAPDRVERTLAAIGPQSTAVIAFAGCDQATRIESLPDFDEYSRAVRMPSVLAPGVMIGAAMAIDRCLIEAFGPLGEGVFAHDLHLRLRALALGDTALVDRVLVKRRIHSRNLSHALTKAHSVAQADRLRADLDLLLEDLEALSRLPGVSARFERPAARELLDGVLANWYSAVERGSTFRLSRERARVRRLWPWTSRGFGWLRTELGGVIRRGLGRWRMTHDAG